MKELEPKDPPRFFLDRDYSGHWYLVRADRRKDWEAWVEIPEDDEAGWEVPDFAKRLDGSPNVIEFEKPEETE